MVTPPHDNGGGAEPSSEDCDTGIRMEFRSRLRSNLGFWRCRTLTWPCPDHDQIPATKSTLPSSFIQEGGGSNINTKAERSGLEGTQRYKGSTTAKRDQRNKEPNEIMKGSKDSRIQGNRKQGPSRDSPRAPYTKIYFNNNSSSDSSSC